MDQERERIQADLRGLIEGDVHCDDLFLQMYATDASILQVRPMAVVRPRFTSDVVACVKYASENQLSVHARGSGSSVVGGSLGTGIVIDFSYFMRQVLSRDENRVRVQPGLVLAHLNRTLARSDRMFAPDPATRSVTTLGGVVAMNATGSHWLKYGAARDKIRRLRLVLANGKVVDVGPDTMPTDANRKLANQVATILQRRQNIIPHHQPETRINHAGYELHDLVRNDDIDLSRLICGSEGSLALITEAELEIQPIPAHRGVALLFFDSLEKTMQAGLEIIKKEDVAACDLLDRRLLSIAREADERFERLVPTEAEGMLLVEVQAASDSVLRQQLNAVAGRQIRRKKLAFESVTTYSTAERNLFWRMVRRIVPMQFGLKGVRQALPFVEDIAINPELLPKFLGQVHSILNSHEVTASVLAHLGQGVVQIRPQLDLTSENDVAKIRDLAEAIFGAVIENRGTISGGHGDGLLRTSFLRRQYGRVCDVFGEIKQVFDPQNVLNPGVIVDEPRIDPFNILRSTAVSVPVDEPTDEEESEETAEVPASYEEPKKKATLTVLEPQLTWSVSEMNTASVGCNGCARCRTLSPDDRMCPIFRLSPREEASPRSKANLARSLLTGQLDQTRLNDDELKEIADLCVNCHQCRLECPANVDIPKLMTEVKAQYVAVNGLRTSEWLLTRLDFLYQFASRFPRSANFVIRNRMMRWTIDKLFGIAQSRKLPLFSKRSFMRWAQRKRLTLSTRRVGQKVLYFVDAYANWNDIELAQAAVAVLNHNGFDVYVPPGQMLSGMSMISAGLVDRAKRIAAKNVELLAEGVRQGCTILTTEPSAGLALQHEYLNLLADGDSKMVAENTSDISSFLWNLHQTGQLELDFKPLNYSVGYHLPCHQRAINQDPVSIKLMKLIPGLQVQQIEKGCSGMAGTYGLNRSNFRRSLRAGVGLISAMRSPSIMVGATECSTCKIQMEQGTVKPTIHPIKILALAYGLMPELEDLFERRSQELALS